MPKVKVPRKNVTPGEVVTVLSRRLGPGYQVESNGDHRVTVRRAPVSFGLVKVPGRSYFQTLRDKLRWGTPPNYRTEQAGNP